MYLLKLKSGHYAPYDTTDHEVSAKIPVGAVVKAKQSRNYLFHKKAFALLTIGFENQTKYESFEVYRKIQTIKAGFFDEAEGKNGTVYYLPQSLSFDTMNAETFEKWYNATIDIISNDMTTAPETIRAEVESFY